MKRIAALIPLVLSGCAPMVVSNAMQLTPANMIALQDGTPIARLTGYAGNPRATVSFIFPNGDSLAGDAVMIPDVENTMGIWGQTAQPLLSTSTVQMVAIDDRQTMDCRGTFSPRATSMTCKLSDGAIYRDDYIAPMPVKPCLTAHSPSGAQCDRATPIQE